LPIFVSHVLGMAYDGATPTVDPQPPVPEEGGENSGSGRSRECPICALMREGGCEQQFHVRWLQ
jgi:hypothetical protein